MFGILFVLLLISVAIVLMVKHFVTLFLKVLHKESYYY